MRSARPEWPGLNRRTQGAATDGWLSHYQHRHLTACSPVDGMRRRCGGHFTMTDPPRRVNFFNGMILSAADMAAEQQYHQGMRYLHNRLHGYGTVSGLDVTLSDGQLHVSP